MKRGVLLAQVLAALAVFAACSGESDTPLPDAQQVRTDLVGQAMGSWRFESPSDFLGLTVNEKTEQGDTVEYDVSMSLQDPSTGRRYRAEALVVYGKSGGEWQIDSVSGRSLELAFPGQKIANQGRDHIGLGQDHPPYNAVPATSGWHYGQPVAPVRWGVHDEFVADEYRVHNLEHDGIGVHYDCPDGCPELVEQLAGLVTSAVDAGLKVLMSPYPGMDTRVALTAWTFIDRLDEFDDERIRDFINAHESSPNAPERYAR